MHIAQIGTGRVGRPTAYTIMCAGLADTLTVCDTKPRLASAFAEELKHVTASLKIDIDVNSCEKDEEVAGADIILISAGEPRIPGIKMSRRGLATQNAKVVKHVSEATAQNNRGAKYIVITNPVDAMAMICKKFSKADFVVSTGTNLESLRFRARLTSALRVSVSAVEGWVGGEHGDAAFILWSTVKIDGVPVGEYVESTGKSLLRAEVDSYVKSVSKFVVDNLGGTEYGPAASFRDITRAIVQNTREIFPVATPMKFAGVHEPVFLSVPVKLGTSLGESLFEALSVEEKIALGNAAEAIYQTYYLALQELES